MVTTYAETVEGNAVLHSFRVSGALECHEMGLVKDPEVVLRRLKELNAEFKERHEAAVKRKVEEIFQPQPKEGSDGKLEQ
jgi:hypothetical protein